MDSEKRTVNQFENFDAMYMRERELQSSLERVEVAYVKTVEKYGDYADFRAFAEYIRTVEKLFIENSFRKSSLSQSKNELIEIKIKLLANNSSMDEGVLNTIYDYFKKAGQTVADIYAVADKLAEKNASNSEYQDFIFYIRDIFVNFLNAEEENISTDELKKRLIMARMKVLSSNGKPDLMSLEKIYAEFMNLLGKNND